MLVIKSQQLKTLHYVEPSRLRDRKIPFAQLGLIKCENEHRMQMALCHACGHWLIAKTNIHSIYAGLVKKVGVHIYLRMNRFILFFFLLLLFLEGFNRLRSEIDSHRLHRWNPSMGPRGSESLSRCAIAFLCSSCPRWGGHGGLAPTAVSGLRGRCNSASHISSRRPPWVGISEAVSCSPKRHSSPQRPRSSNLCLRVTICPFPFYMDYDVFSIEWLYSLIREFLGILRQLQS